MHAADLQLDEQRLISKTRRLIGAIGLPATLRLLETLGGTYLELPQGHTWRAHRSSLAELIGAKETDALYREFRADGRKLLVPKADKIIKQVRDREICAEAPSMSERDQALKYRLTIRQIQNIRKRGITPPTARPASQFDLFPALLAPVRD